MAMTLREGEEGGGGRGGEEGGLRSRLPKTEWGSGCVLSWGGGEDGGEDEGGAAFW